MIDVQEAKFLQKVGNKLFNFFNIIEEDVRYAAKHGNSQVEIDFCCMRGFDDHLAEIIDVLGDLGFEASSPSYGFLRVEWGKI